MQTYAHYVCCQNVVVGHWLTGARFLLLHAVATARTTTVPDVSYAVKNYPT